MKVVVERFGGFAGVHRRGERDGSELTIEQHADLKKILAGSGTELPPDPGADRFTYRVGVEDETGTKQVTVPESVLPKSLAKIVTD
jgi:hypothetical protein